MENDIVWVVLPVIGLAIVFGLSCYATKLLLRLRRQNRQIEALNQQKVDDIANSIKLIAKAMVQQQCGLSEGCIRICVLQGNLPARPHVDYANSYPALYGLYEKIKHYPTHEARKQLKKNERMKQDLEREELEAQFESDILKEVENLITFSG